MAKAIIQDYVAKNAETMPHRSRTTCEGDRDNHHVLAGVYKQQDILCEVNITRTSLGSETISHSTLSRLWRMVFTFLFSDAPITQERQVMENVCGLPSIKLDDHHYKGSGSYTRF